MKKSIIISLFLLLAVIAFPQTQPDILSYLSKDHIENYIGGSKTLVVSALKSKYAGFSMEFIMDRGEESLHINITDNLYLIFIFDKGVCFGYWVIYPYEYLNDVIKHLDQLCSRNNGYGNMLFWTYYSQSGDIGISLIRSSNNFTITIARQILINVDH